MKKSKLFELYQTLSTIERRRFKEYVESPFFNTNVFVIKLQNYISSTIDREKEVADDRKEIFRRIAGKEKYDDQKTKNTMTILMSLLEGYMAQLKYEKNEFLSKEFLLTSLRERNLHKQFLSNASAYSKKLAEKKIYDSDYFFEKYILEREQDYYFIKKEIRKSNENLQRKSDSFDFYYMSEKLKNLCDMINRKNVIAASYNITLLPELRGFIKENIKTIEVIPAIFIYYKILLTLLEPDVDQHFSDLKHLLSTHEKKFSKKEARQMYDYAENYCIKKVNNGSREYLHELFEIYESLLLNEIIFENKQLSHLDYKNIVSIGIKLGKFDWTKHFIEKYKTRIAIKFRENAYEYNLASLYYNKKDYKGALKLLQRVNFTDSFYHLGAKSMLLKMYYELEEVEPFYSMVDAYKVYLVRNKDISNYQRKVHSTFVRYTKQTFDLKLKGHSGSNQKAILLLQERVNLEKNDTNLSWLHEKLDDLLRDA